jgi:hypothetical protein
LRAPARCAGLNVASKRNQKEERTFKGKISKTRDETVTYLNLLLLHLEGTALGLDRLLQADDGGTLLLEGLLLIRTLDAKSYQFALEL